MKRRTLNYLKKSKARNIFQRVLDVDLTTFLAATLELSQSFKVKRDVRDTLYQLGGYSTSGMRA